MDTDRGPIEKPAVDLLKSQVADALKGKNDLGGKGLPDNKVRPINRVEGHKVDKQKGKIVSTEMVDKQMIDHDANKWNVADGQQRARLQRFDEPDTKFASRQPSRALHV
jgi:hypothetical protein